MWKDEYLLGVDIIDLQHKELFVRTEELLREIYQSGIYDKEKIVNAILFLKHYAVKHFSDEEEHQKSIGYKKYGEHKKEHEDFIAAVLEYEKELVASDFSEEVVKKFTGVLAAWLVYHVASSDLEIKKGAGEVKTFASHSDIILHGVVTALNKMAGIDDTQIKRVGTHDEAFTENVSVRMAIKGDIRGSITIVCPHSFIKDFVNKITNMEVTSIGELETAVVVQMSEIVGSIVCKYINTLENVSCSPAPPQVTERPEVFPDERIAVDTGQGILEIDLRLKYS